MLFEYFADHARDGTITRKIRRDKDGSGTEALRANRRHGRADAEAPGLIGRGADNGTIAPPGNDDRLAAKIWVIALLHRRIERIHVDVNDLADGHRVPVLRVSSEKRATPR